MVKNIVNFTFSIYIKIFLLIFFLQFLGCSNSQINNKKETVYNMIGETVVLVNQAENELSKKNIYNLKLYSIDNSGVKSYYKDKVDYTFLNNLLKRTSNSNIPNYSFHNVLYNADGTFTFSSIPRNPSLTIPFQVYADYNFIDSELQEGIFEEQILSINIKNKLKSKFPLRIGVLGTSISAGAHTLSSFYQSSDAQTYHHLVAKALKKSFGSEVLILNYSKNGSTIGDIFNSLPAIIQDNNDLVFIEFGMNDHIGKNWLANKSLFEKNMEKLIKKFKDNDTDVVLVGFFQQNPSWDMEYKGSTKAYNQSIYNLSKKYNCFFADINYEFSKYSQTKIDQDICGDFMHHPTSFGHLLYYKTIMTLFSEKGTTDGDIYNLVN